ncbi:MAG: two-component system, OmpR family, response regulator [Chloroflexota bacterium]|nr:two-component system, OmpR family, response regulator [Chloroflexota bacterium]
MLVLVIEDDKRLAKLIGDVLADEDIRMDVSHDGNEGLEMALSGKYDVAIVDWMLPGRDGPSICRSLRNAHIDTALLILTARGQVEDRVAGLDSGADDYLVKPFSFDELLARLRALARRCQPVSSASWELRVGRIVMDLKAHTVRRGDQAIELTRTEWDLLEYMLRHTGQTLPRRNILEYIWSDDAAVKPELVDVYISYLRKKLNVPGLPDPLQTVRGVGYRLDGEHA